MLESEILLGLSPLGHIFIQRVVGLVIFHPLAGTRGYFKALSHVWVTSYDIIWHQSSAATEECLASPSSWESVVSTQAPGMSGRPGRCLLSAIVFTHSSIKVSQLSPDITHVPGLSLVTASVSRPLIGWLWLDSSLVSHQHVRETDPVCECLQTQSQWAPWARS